MSYSKNMICYVLYKIPMPIHVIYISASPSSIQVFGPNPL